MKPELRETDDRSTGAEFAGEPLTPELALVDPELARRAREQLRHRREPRPAAVEGEERPPAPRLRVARPTATGSGLDGKVPRPKRWRRRAIIVIAVLAAAATGAVLRAAPFEDPFWRSTEPAFSPDVREPSARVPPAETVSPPTTPRRPVQSGKKAPRPSQPSVKPKRRAAAARPAAGSQRAFAWVPVPKATNYLVQFFRGRREIFEAHPAEARILVPHEWTFKGRRYRLGPGRYRWSVRPGFGRPGRGRYGRPVVAAELVVPATSVG